MGPSEAGRCSPRYWMLPLSQVAWETVACVGNAYRITLLWKVYYSWYVRGVSVHG